MRRLPAMTGTRRLLAAGLLLAAVGAAATLEECRKHEHHGRQSQASACFRDLLDSSDPYLRAEAAWGLGMLEQANEQFREAVKAKPGNRDYRVRWGRLLLEGNNKADAANLFQEVLKEDEKHPRALLGLALAASESFDKKAVELAEKAIEIDPRLAEARELMARLALEDVDPEKAAREARAALEIDAEQLGAMAVLAAVDLLDNQPTEWLDRIHAINPVYGEAYATLGHFFVMNRRYEEGIAHYRKALELKPNLWPARAELGVNLMRLGQEEEAKRQLELCYENGHRDAKTVNTLRLMDSYKNFVTFRGPGTIVRLHKKEAELLRPYIEGELQRAVATFEKKYQLKLDRPVQLEVYPDHEDFAVRTMGMPGLGALGVTFGYVVAMDSPSGRSPGSFHWASTLWHELSHVFVLAATEHRVPRWFTEGVAVHEETAVSPDWGDRMTPDVIAAIKGKKLLPVEQLDRGFIRPSYPSQVPVSYFQAGKICDYIVKHWSYRKLLDMMHSYAKLKPTDEVFREHLGIEPEEFDKRFLAELEAETKATVEGLDEWMKSRKALSALVRSKQHDEVIAKGKAIRDLYPDYVEAGNVYEILADAYEAKGDRPAATAELKRYAEIGGRSPETIKKLARWLEEDGRNEEAARQLERLNFVYPVDEELHRRLGRLWLELGKHEGAIREFTAVVAMNPLDKASSHFDLALAYKKANRIEQAQEQVFLALEAAPGFRPAQKLLLELNR